MNAEQLAKVIYIWQRLNNPLAVGGGGDQDPEQVARDFEGLPALRKQRLVGKADMFLSICGMVDKGLL